MLAINKGERGDLNYPNPVGLTKMTKTSSTNQMMNIDKYIVANITEYHIISKLIFLRLFHEKKCI